VSVIFTKESQDLFVFRIEGLFTFDDLKEAQSKTGGAIERSEAAKLLVLAEEFSGWGKDGNWGDLTFMYEHDPYIEKIAIVANAKWLDEMLMFLGAGRRQADVESFHSEQAARNWLWGESE
jgi:hypothetical protein